MNLKTLAAAACLLVCTATSSVAVTANVNGQDYDITTVTGSFNDLETTLTQQAWWGDVFLATDFSTAVGTQLGTFANQYGIEGPLFAYLSSNIDFYATSFAPSSGKTFNSGFADLGATNTFAIAAPTAVPLPAGGVLLLSGLIGAFGLKRRKARAA